MTRRSERAVGYAFGGSNPSPATTCENGPLAGNSRLGGPFFFVPPCVTLSRCRPLCCGAHGHIADGIPARERYAWTLLARIWPAHGAQVLNRRARSGLTFAAESSVHFPAPGCCPGVSVGGRPGKGGARMAGAAVRESATFAGRPDQVRRRGGRMVTWFELRYR
jgi:hypothetical protein